MTTTALVSGKLFRDPERKVSRGDKLYVLATVRDGQGDDATWWKVLAFGTEACDELLGLKAGDAVAMSGTLKAEVYTPSGGEPRVSLSVLADRVISAHRQKKEKAAEARTERKAERNTRRTGRPTNGQDGLLEHAAARPFNDEIPF